MDLKEKRKILYRYVCASIEGKLPASSAFVSGLGNSPDLDAHAYDVANIIVRTYKQNKMDIHDLALKQLRCILIHCQVFY